MTATAASTPPVPSDENANGSMQVYPPAAARGRSVLVRNISHAATGAAIDDFFSFCGAIESKQVRTVPPHGGGGNPTLEAVVVFADEAARHTALMMNDSVIVDQPVTIVAVPTGYDFNSDSASSGGGVAMAPSAAGLMGELGGFFSSFTSSVSEEWKKATRAIDVATESGVLRQAKDGAREFQARTMELASELDDRYHVRNTLLNAAETTKSTANVLIEQTRNVATQVDSQYHISEKTTQFADKAMENPTVRNAQRSIASLLSQVGLEADGDEPAPAPLPPNSATEPPAPPTAAPETTTTAPANGAPTS